MFKLKKEPKVEEVSIQEEVPVETPIKPEEPKKEVTIEEVLISHEQRLLNQEQRILQLESKFFRLGGI